MLEKIDLSRKLSKAEYKTLIPYLQRRLYDLEKTCWDANMPSIIVFEGWDALQTLPLKDHISPFHRIYLLEGYRLGNRF